MALTAVPPTAFGSGLPCACPECVLAPRGEGQGARGSAQQPPAKLLTSSQLCSYGPRVPHTGQRLRTGLLMRKQVNDCKRQEGKDGGRHLPRRRGHRDWKVVSSPGTPSSLYRPRGHRRGLWLQSPSPFRPQIPEAQRALPAPLSPRHPVPQPHPRPPATAGPLPRLPPAASLPQTGHLFPTTPLQSWRLVFSSRTTCNPYGTVFVSKI